MVSTSGAQLLKPAAVKALCGELLPLATLITPNLDEAEILVGEKLSSVTDLRAAARELHGRFGCAVLVKGGHLRGLKEAVDIFYDGAAGAAAERPVHPGREHARHGVHLFRGDCRASGAGLRVAEGGGAGQGIHHSSHRAEPDRRRAQRPQLLLAVTRTRVA